MSEPDSRPVYCLFCDDIRTELGGKLSFMGLYGAELILNIPFPAILPKLGVIIGMIHKIGDQPKFIKVKIYGPVTGEEVAQFDINDIPPQPIEEGMTKGHLRLTFQLVPFAIPQAGSVEVFVETERDSVRAGRLKISTKAEPASSDALGDNSLR
ncbi:MAG TPA: hypothetical protein VD932_01130 [Aquabacterium sp.]|nr:hypothetical protein [Aquabacterium sp.]